MQPIDGKQIETPENKFYGVDVNNRMAVEQEFQRLRKRHRTVTILVILALIVLGFFVFDYIRVTEMGGKPYIALKEKVEDGTKYKGIGYEVLYCSNDESEDRLFGIVNIVLVKEERLVAKHKKLNIDRSYTLFKPLRFSVAPSYIEGKSKTKYIEMELNEIRIDHDILVEK